MASKITLPSVHKGARVKGHYFGRAYTGAVVYREIKSASRVDYFVKLDVALADGRNIVCIPYDTCDEFYYAKVYNYLEMAA